jgi:hypothetical protein
MKRPNQKSRGSKNLEKKKKKRGFSGLRERYSYSSDRNSVEYGMERKNISGYLARKKSQGGNLANEIEKYRSLMNSSKKKRSKNRGKSYKFSSRLFAGTQRSQQPSKIHNLYKSLKPDTFNEQNGLFSKEYKSTYPGKGEPQSPGTLDLGGSYRVSLLKDSQKEELAKFLFANKVRSTEKLKNSFGSGLKDKLRLEESMENLDGSDHLPYQFLGMRQSKKSGVFEKIVKGDEENEISVVNLSEAESKVGYKGELNILLEEV